MFIFLIHPAFILIPTAIAFTTGNAQVIIGDKVTPLGYTQTLYEFTSLQPIMAQITLEHLPILHSGTGQLA